MGSEPRSEAQFQAWRTQLTTEQLRFLFHFKNEWEWFGAQIEERIIDAAMDKDILPGDTVDHTIVQNVLACLGEFCQAMGTPPTVNDAILRLLLALEARRNGISDPLTAITKRNPRRLHLIETYFYALLAAAVDVLRVKRTSREKGTSIGAASAIVVEKVKKIERDKSRRLPVKRVPTRIAVQRLYEKRRTDTRFASLCRAILARVPPELLSPDERADWLLSAVAAPRDPVDPHLHALIAGKAIPLLTESYQITPPNEGG